MQYDRLVAPAEHLGLLCEPPGNGMLALATTRPVLSGGTLLDCDGASLRARLLHELGWQAPVILSGHQAEFFHAGVLAKNVAADRLAAQTRGTAAFLLVDTDVPKAALLAVPQVRGGVLRRVYVPIPGADPRATFADQPVVPRDQWLSFFAAIGALHGGYDASLLPVYARAWLQATGPQLDYCTAWSAAQVASEAALSLHGLRYERMTHLAERFTFRIFAAHLILNAQASAAAYNAAQAAYRARHRVRAPGRPVPPLQTANGAVEVPLWLSRAGSVRRRLFVAHEGERVTLLAEHEPIATLSATALADPATHEQSWPLDGWRLQPRALTLSAFCRLLLADVFIHGIGGAKYDEVTEGYIAGLLGVTLPPLACVSATLHLPLPRPQVELEDIRDARRNSRDLHFNPQRHLSEPPPELITRHRELLRRAAELAEAARTPPRRRWRAERRVVHQELGRVRTALLATDPWRAAEYDRRVRTLEEQWQQAQIARDRECFYALHPEATLAQLVEHLGHTLRGTA